MKKTLQHRHLRRRHLELIVQRAGRKSTALINKNRNQLRRRKDEEGRKVFGRNLEEYQSEENPISNRRLSPTIIPPLTVSLGVRNVLLFLGLFP